MQEPRVPYSGSRRPVLPFLVAVARTWHSSDYRNHRFSDDHPL